MNGQSDIIIRTFRPADLDQVLELFVSGLMEFAGDAEREVRSYVDHSLKDDLADIPGNYLSHPLSEADEFREAMGLDEPAVERVKQVCYNTVGLVSFLTVGEDEVRAWPVPAGMAAQTAAGTIHTDFTRGFIRAEVIPYDDLVRCGSLAQGRKEGVLRSEGKTYQVKDGDVINFLINT